VLNILFRILAVLTVFVLIVLLIGTLIPRGFSTSSSVSIEAPPERIFVEINRIKRWSNWTMWNEQEVSGLRVEYPGAEAGVGAIQTWTEPRGAGKLWITESLENERVNFTSLFANFPEMQSSITLRPEGDATRVQWKSEGALPSGPFYGWFGLTFSDSLAREYRKSLNRLKRLCEQDTQQAAAASAADPDAD
jgi:hypothetical protein